MPYNHNHVDPWCVKNCDPFKESELNEVNTPVCEQMFTKINRHRNCKSMNEARYFMFWFHYIDLHITYLREPIVSKALERKLREWTIVNTLEALDSKFILTKALTKL